MLADRLSPLRKYLRAQVGRPWNKVWSEICADLSPRSTMHEHLRDHVLREVERDGIGSRTGFWVDPRTGLLRHGSAHRGDRKRRLAAEWAARRKRRVVVDDRLQYHRLDDRGWWEVTLAPIPTELPVRDVVLAPGLSDLGPFGLYGRWGVYAAAKRQLSKREIKRLGLPRA